MARNATIITADDVLDLPVPEGVSGYELVDGRPVPVMPASPLHGELIVAERLFRGVPDLAIEIDLASGWKPGGQQRVLDWLEAGVRLVWVIDPHSRTAVVYRPDGSARLVREDEDLEGEDVVPGFRLPLGSLFA